MIRSAFLSKFSWRSWSQGSSWSRRTVLKHAFYSTDRLELLKFNPLPPKPTERTSLYTGPLRWPATDTFYQQFQTRRLVPKFSTEEISGLVAPAAVDPGDVVEVLTRDGKIQAFGMVTFSVDDTGQFDLISTDGKVVQGCVHDVSFALRGYFPRLPAGRYDLMETRAKLIRMIQQANQRMQSVLSLLSVVHSEYAVEGQPRALDFMFICRHLDKLLRPGMPAYNKQEPIADRLSVYLALAYHSLLFVRLRNSSFVAVASKTAASVNKVMYGLTRTELEHGVSELMQSQKVHNTDSVAGMLQDFLQHWILWNDPRLVRAVEAVLEECVGNSRTVDSPRALSSIVNQLHNKFDLFPWVSRRPSTETIRPELVSPSPSPSPPSPPPLSSSSPPSPPSGSPVNTATVGNVPPKAKSQHSHLFTTNLVQGSVFLNRSLTANFDSEHSLLNIFIPRVSRVPSTLSAKSIINVKARSAWLNATYYPLIAEAEAAKYVFMPGVESSAVRLQVRVDRRTLKFDEKSIIVSLTETVPITLGNMAQFSELHRVLSHVEPLISDHELQLPEETLPSAPHHSSMQMMSLHAQAAAGRIAGIFFKHKQIEAPFLVSNHGREVVSNAAGYHDRMGCDAYVPIARPLDSSLALLAQKKILGTSVPTLYYSGRKRPPLEAKLSETLLPGLDLVAHFEERDRYQRALKSLEAELQESPIFHIFRCVLLQSGRSRQSSEAQIIRAYCHDLDLDVDVVLPAHSEPVFAGDQVICTEILELDPLFGVFVVSL